MDLLNQLEIYISAQKGVGLHAFIFGSALLLAALFFHLFGVGSLSNGIRIGCLVLGIILFIMGFGLRISQDNILKAELGDLAHIM